MMPPGLVTGFAAETRIARRSGWPTACSGGQPSLARAAAEALLAGGASGLISFGIAGGLKPGLPPGSIVIADRIVTGLGEYPTSPDWLARFHDALPNALIGPILGAETPITEPDLKRDLHARTRALAVDLESAAVAEACTRDGLPFTAIRVIADPAERALPPAALVGLRPDGGIAAGTVLLSLVREPGQVPALWRLARDTRRALAGLAAIPLRQGF
jgi:hopanoid-associated phosphorylase